MAATDHHSDGRGQAAPAVDFDLHGLVRVRLLDARPADVQTVTRQLGPMQAPVAGSPDLTVRFVDRLDRAGPVTYVTWPEAGFVGEDFLVLRGKGNTVGAAALPLDRIGGGIEIVCERTLGPVPHLLAVLNLTALGKGVLPLHASAFEYEGSGVLVTGWAKGGKTETLLAFMARGARYIGDEWVYLTTDGRMYGVPEPIRLWRWQLRQLPGVLAAARPVDRARLGGLDALARGSDRAARAVPAGPPAAILRRLAPLLRRQVYLQIPPAELFGADALALRGRLDRVVLAVSTEDPQVRARPVAGGEVARRMAASLAEERAAFLASYRQFRFAFPDRRSDLVDSAPELERRLLETILGARDAVLLQHPYPPDLDSLVPPVLAGIAGRAEHRARPELVTVPAPDPLESQERP
jgi:hypothetical protein